MSEHVKKFSLLHLIYVVGKVVCIERRIELCRIEVIFKSLTLVVHQNNLLKMRAEELNI